MIKIVNFADWHVGHNQYSQLNPETGLSYRVESALKVLDDIISYTLKNKIKVIVLAGDVYKSPHIADSIQFEFNRRITEVASKGVKVLVLMGNHDVSKMEQQKSPLSHFEAMNVPNVIVTRFHKEYIYEENGEKIKFVFIPTYHTSEEIEDIVNKTTYDGFPIYYIMHGTLRGSMLNDWLVEEKETYVDPEVFDKPGVAAVALGHLHKFQILYNKPVIFYTGSTNRIDFTEEKQEKGFVVTQVEPDGYTTYDYIEVDSIKFFTLKNNLIGIEDPTEHLINELNNNSHKIDNAILRIRVEMEKTQVLNEKRIYERAKELGASHILDIQKQIERTKSVRIAGLDEHITEEKALEMYYSERENGEDFISVGKEIIRRAREAGKI